MTEDKSSVFNDLKTSQTFEEASEVTGPSKGYHATFERVFEDSVKVFEYASKVLRGYHATLTYITRPCMYAAALSMVI